MGQYSIRTLMAFVVVSGVGLAALRNSNVFWASLFTCVVLAAVGVAIIGAVVLRGMQQAWSLGFTIFSGGYLLLIFEPGLSSNALPWLPTTVLIDSFSSDSLQPHAFVRVGHSLVALLTGLVGAAVAVLFYVRRERADAAG